MVFAIILTSFRRGFICSGLSLPIYNYVLRKHKGGAGGLSKTWRRSLSRGSTSPTGICKRTTKYRQMEYTWMWIWSQ